MSNIVKVDQSIAPRSIDELERFSNSAAASGMYGLTSAAEAFVRIATGLELGLSAMQSLRCIHVVKGRPVLSADLMAALVLQRRDVCEYFRVVETTNEIATYETKRVGAEPIRYSFSMADAKAANLLGKDSWRNFPAAMLRARCISALARMVYPDIVAGLYDPDELPEDRPAKGPSVAKAAPRLAVAVDAVPEFTPAELTPVANTPPAANDTGASLESMRAAILGATTLAELSEVSLTLSARKKELAPHRDELRKVYSARRDELTAEAIDRGESP